NHYRDCDGEKSHGGFARPVDRPAALDESPRDPAAAHRTYIGDQIDRRYIGDERRPFHSVILIEKLGQPEEIEPTDRIGQHFSEGEGPELAVAEQRQPGRLLLELLRLAVAHQFELLVRQALVLFRALVENQPENEPEQADRAGENESAAPAIMGRKQ